MIAIDLSKQQVRDADLNAKKKKKKKKFTWNPARDGDMFFIIEGAKETVLDLLQGTVKVS